MGVMMGVRDEDTVSSLAGRLARLDKQLDDKEQETKAREMQRAWIAFRDTTCDFYWHKIRGSMAVPMGAACRLRETARRALFLAFLTGV